MMYRWLEHRQLCAYIWEVFQRTGSENHRALAMDQADNQASSVVLLYHLQFRATQGRKLQQENHGNN